MKDYCKFFYAIKVIEEQLQLTLKELTYNRLTAFWKPKHRTSTIFLLFNTMVMLGKFSAEIVVSIKENLVSLSLINAYFAKCFSSLSRKNSSYTQPSKQRCTVSHRILWHITALVSRVKCIIFSQFLGKQWLHLITHVKVWSAMYFASQHCRLSDWVLKKFHHSRLFFTCLYILLWAAVLSLFIIVKSTVLYQTRIIQFH